MKILIIKMSSIGDIIHTFPAVIDAKYYFKDIQIDWLVDENFVDIVKLQDNIIHNIIAIPLRKTKKNFLLEIINFKFKNFFTQLNKEQYNLVIDAQGLLKSAIIATLVNTEKIVGFNANSCREPLASFFYHDKIQVDKNLHAILRVRQLFAKSLNYSLEDFDFGLNVFEKKKFPKLAKLNLNNKDRYILFLHGTTWETKHWKLEYWQKLSLLITNNHKNTAIVIMTNNLQEQQFAEQLSAINNNIIVLSKLNIKDISSLLANAIAIVAVDTGFAHLSGALGVPVIGIYGATSIAKAGIIGENAINLQSKYHCSPCLSRVCLEYKNKLSNSKQPCLQEITPEMVFNQLEKIIYKN